MPDAPVPSDHPDDHPLAVAEAFAVVGQRLASQTRTTDALQALVEHTVQMVPGTRWVSVTRGRDDQFTTIASTDKVATEADKLQYRLGTGPCVDAVVNESVFESSDLALDDRWSSFGPQAAHDHGTRSVLSIRLQLSSDDNLSSGLNLYGDRVGAFDDDSRKLATVLATHAAVAVDAVIGREQSQHLQQALISNREIGVAMGVLMTRHHITRQRAFDVLRIASQNQNRKLRDIASDVADTGELPLPRARRAPEPNRGTAPGGRWFARGEPPAARPEDGDRSSR